jgi:hypothetical protein
VRGDDIWKVLSDALLCAPLVWNGLVKCEYGIAMVCRVCGRVGGTAEARVSFLPASIGA